MSLSGFNAANQLIALRRKLTGTEFAF